VFEAVGQFASHAISEMLRQYRLAAC
jgi:hypothetical protein